MSKGSPPPAPDYVGAAQAQGAANTSTAIQNAALNAPNVVSPYGTTTISQPPAVAEQTQFSFNPEAYLRANPDVAANANYRGDPWLHYTRFGRAEGRQGDWWNTPQVVRPTVTQQLSPEQQEIYNLETANKAGLGHLGQQGIRSMAGLIGSRLDLSGAPGTGNYDDTRKKVIDAMMSRTNEDYGKRSDQSNSDLIAAGIRPGSKAYADAQQMIERSRNDAYTQAEIAGGNAASQAYGMDEARRRQYITEVLAQRQTPLNEITALLSGSQTSNPFTMPGYAAGANAQPAPIASGIAAQGQYATDAYNAQQAQQANMMNGLFSLGSSGTMRLSDRRLKSNIQRIGTHPLGIGYYAYDIAGRHEEGVMADEVLAVKPEAVHQHVSGYLMVDYGSL